MRKHSESGVPLPAPCHGPSVLNCHLTSWFSFLPNPPERGVDLGRGEEFFGSARALQREGHFKSNNLVTEDGFPPIA